MKKIWLFLIFFMILAGRLPAQQKQGAWWYFGGLGGVLPNNAGVNFNTTPPIPDFAGQGASSYSSATISDANGNLLFYADGLKFYNRNHQVMPNGILPSLSQGAGMIVQKPGNPYLYYYFHIQSGSTGFPNFFYTIIDMRLGGGKGGIVAASKNTLIFSTPVAWKLTASLHSNNTDVWIVVHGQQGTNSYYSFLLSASGISQPVVSAVGVNYLYSTPSGTLKSSPNSTLIADAITWDLRAQLLDFDRSNGVLSNPRTFTSIAPLMPWGIAFSPDASKLYLSAGAGSSNPSASEINQYNLNAGSFANVLASKTKINSNANLWLYDMQLGMDGKIYVLCDGARPYDPILGLYNSHLSVINCPNALGLSSGYQDTVIYLNRPGGANLPALNQTLFRNANQLQVIAERPYICQGESVKLSAFGAGAGQFTWLPAPGLGTINGAEAIVQPTVTTTYTVVGTGACHTDTARVTVVVAPPAYVNAGPDQSICSGATVQLGTSLQPGYSYTWHTSANLSDSTIAHPTFSVVNTGTTNRVYQFIVRMEGPGATCGKEKDTVRITVKPQIVVNAGPAKTFCSGIPTVLQPQQFNSAYAYSWSLATGLSNANTFAPTLTLTNTSANPDTLIYTLTATINGCSRSSPVQVIVLPEPRPVIYGPASVCPGSPQIAYQVQNPLPGNTYIWGVRGGTLSQTFGDSIWVNWGAASATAAVWALGSNSFNCPGDTVFFPVLVNPLLQTETPNGNSTLCENDKQNQLYQVARAQGSVYTWGISGGIINSGQGSHAVRVNWPGPGQYKLWVQESAQTSLAQCYGVSDTLRITVLPSPDTTLAVQGPASVCEQSQQSYSLAGNAGSAYQWQVIGGTIVSGQGSGSVQVTWHTVGQGEVKVQETLPNGCIGTWLTLSVQVNPIPVTTFPAINAFCPEALTQTHQVQGMPGSVFQWQVTGGTLLSGQGTSQATIRWDSLSVNHSYSVIETTASGCSSAAQSVAVAFDRSALKLLSVGLDEAEENLIIQYKLQYPPLTPPANLQIFAENNQTGQWESIGQSSLADTVFRAPAAAFEMRHFRLQGRNTCSNEIFSKAHRPVKLTAAGDENSGEVKLSWNAYKGWPGTIQYEVWRKLEGQIAFEKLAVTTDSSIVLKTGRDGFRQRYRIKAVSATDLESWSQSVGVDFQNELSFPNIITPNSDGLNDTFTASNLHLYPNSSLKIFNRWGQEVFSSQNYRGEWQAEGLSSGTYFYLLQTPNGRRFKGWVEVVK